MVMAFLLISAGKAHAFVAVRWLSHRVASLYSNETAHLGVVQNFLAFDLGALNAVGENIRTADNTTKELLNYQATWSFGYLAGKPYR